MDESMVDLERRVSAASVLGYLNFSQGRPDPRWQKALGDAYAFFTERGAEAPWQALRDWQTSRLAELQASGAAAFRDASQARAVLGLVYDGLLPAYRRHHADLLAHRNDRELLQPFFVVRTFEAVLSQGSPWEETERIVSGALAQLNDFLGYRPLAVLETRPRGEPYDHERVRPIPLFLRGAGVAAGRRRDLIAQTLDILAATAPPILADAHFDLELLDELAVDPRAYDHGHPVNRRPNYIFGEWDPHHIDNQGRYRRFVVRPITLDALLDRVEQGAPTSRSELLFEAAAVLAGTMLMAAGISGSGPSAHDSSATLARLMPGIARYRETFYSQVLQRLPGAHGERLRHEVATSRQPFGGARQHLNQYLARQRAEQLQQRYLAMLFAEMGYPEAGRREAARIPAVSVRMLSEVLGRLSTGRFHLDRGELAPAAALLPEIEDLLHRGIACGAFVDPWNILGFQGLFPLSSAREDSVRDPRIDELVQLVQQILDFYARLLSEAAAAGEERLVGSLTRNMQGLATWWDRFASVEVGEVRRVHGGEAAASAEHVATALARWHERGEATADLNFWRQHLDGFRSPKAFALVVDALLRKGDHRAALALLMNWLSQREQVPLEEGDHSFHTLALRWMLGLVSGERAGTWPLIRRFFDHLEVNADDYWQVPELGAELLPMPREAEEEDDLYGAAYEGVTYRDSADDDEEGSVADGGPQQEFILEGRGEALGQHLRFLATVSRLWMLAARQDGEAAEDGSRRETLRSWLAMARERHQQILALLDTLQACVVPSPLGSEESLIEYDRRRVLKEQLLYQAIATCLDSALAVGALHAVAEKTVEGDPAGEQPEWEPWGVRLEQAVLHGDAASVRALLPRFLVSFQREPLLFVALSDGGQPRQILRARLAQAMLQALLSALPRLGLLRETYHLLKTARAMEQAQPPAARGVTQFNHLFEAAYQGVVECVVFSAIDWHIGDRDLVDLLETLTEPFLKLWVEHSRTMQVAVLEAVRSEEEWQSLRELVQRYGADLFHARFMTLANLRGILHRGVGHHLDYLRDNPDPLHPIRLIDDLDEEKVPRERVQQQLQLILQAVVENYEEYKDYNTTTTHSDYGDHLHMLLDFLRLKASYERRAWQFRPLLLAHEVLARGGLATAAVLWEEAFTHSTRELAAEHLEALARLERTHGMRLGTVADRLQERFVKPLALDRLCALIEPAMDEAREQGPRPAFARLEQELQAFVMMPSGVGLDVPHWLRRLESEVQQVRTSQTSLAVLAENVFQMPERTITRAELQQQLQDWDRPLLGD